MSLWPEIRHREEANAATVCLSPLSALQTSQRTGARDPDQCGTRSLLRILSTERRSPKYHIHKQYSNDSCISNIPKGWIARVLVSNVSSLPKRKVMAFASWIPCVLTLHLRVSICSHFSSVLASQSPLCHCSLTCCGLSRSGQRMMSSPLHHLSGHLFSCDRACSCPMSLLEPRTIVQTFSARHAA